MKPETRLPAWIDYGLLPALHLGLALMASALVVWALGANPLLALPILLSGGIGEGMGFALFYATDFLLLGLAVVAALRAGLYNLGGEGQALFGGFGVALVAIALDPLQAGMALPLALLAAALFGALWGLVPGWLHACRSAPLALTTILFNFLAVGIVGGLVSGPAAQSQESAPDAAGASAPLMPAMADLLAPLGLGAGLADAPWNASFLVALACALGLWVFLFHSRIGYELRVVGGSREAARYAGIRVDRHLMAVMALAGAMAGLAAVNQWSGGQPRLALGVPGGYAFVGLAVALLGRGHPLGVVPAALIFGALYQGGVELARAMPELGPDLVLVLQGLAILFAGGLERLLRARMVGRRRAGLPAEEER